MKQEILQVLLEWNPWYEEEFPENLVGIKRDYNSLSYLEIEEIKILVGARRSGKSTLLYKVMKQAVDQKKRVLYINFQDEILSKYSLSDIYYCFLEREQVDFLFLDEVQDCSDWVHFVRKMYDSKKLEQIWITGSNSDLIKQEYAELLTGRNLTLQVFPLSFREFLRFNGLEEVKLPFSREKESQVKKMFSEYLKYGAFPAVALRKVYKKELLQNYYEDFIYKDIASRYDVNVAKIKDLGIFLATNISKVFSYRSISKSLDLHQKTVADYLSYFEEIYLFDVVHRFDFSLKKQLSHDKKIYAVDVGLAAAISFQFSQNTGRMLENLVYCELKRRKAEIYYHKEKRECDFLVKQELKITQAIQVCVDLSSDETFEREVEGLIEALSVHELSEGLILTLDTEKGIERAGKKVSIMPVWKWLLV